MHAPSSQAENDFVTLYDRIGSSLPGHETIAAARADAIAALRQHGLPTRRVEAWHYTDLRNRLREVHAPAPRPDLELAKQAFDGHNWLPEIIRLPIINGHYIAELADELPDDVILARLGDAESALIDGALDQANAINVLNTAFVTDGFSMIVEEDTSIRQTIGIANAFCGDQSAMATSRNNVVVCRGAWSAFAERHVGPNDVAYTSNTVTNLWLGEGARARWVICQEEGDLATHLAQLNVTLGDDTDLEIFVVNAGGLLVRREINVEVVGENANLNIRGVNLAGGEAHVDVTTVLNHTVAHTNSSQIYRNASTERGSGVFQGRIQVAQKAQKTDAAMACNTLLLSDECDFSAKPELEIFADDVLCAHGATIADLSEDHLFYLMARGIFEREARNLLVKAFLEEVLEELDDQPLREALIRRIDRWLDARQ